METASSFSPWTFDLGHSLVIGHWSLVIPWSLVIGHRSLVISHPMTPRIEIIATRSSLIKRLKNWDDRASWKDFFDTYWKLIYGVARAAGLNDAEAQDVVQETIICVAQKMP